MSKPAKIFVGVLSLRPLAYMFIFFAFFFGTFFGTFFTAAGGGEPAPPFAFGFGAIFILHGLTILLTFALTAFYVYRFFRDDSLDETKTLLWSLLVFMGNMIAFPIAWYVHVWTEGEALDSGESGRPERP